MAHLLEYACDGTASFAGKPGQVPLSSLLLDVESEHVCPMPSRGGLWFSRYRFSVREDLMLDEHMAAGGFCLLSFCLGEGMELSFEGAGGAEMRFERGEGRVVYDATERCTTRYLRGAQYQGASLAFDERRLGEAAECLRGGRGSSMRAGTARVSAAHAISPRLSALLAQMSACRMHGALKSLYLEAKMLELLAVYVSEALCQQEAALDEPALSKGDLCALRAARDVLDKSFAHPPTIAALSQKVLLNEFKLKAGFKRCFGTTVYGYVLDRRMEYACRLLGQGRYRVKDVARMVGYSSASHFIEGFAKRYGTTPGRY